MRPARRAAASATIFDLAVADGRIVEAEHACELGRRWFLADHDQSGLPLATIAGRAAEPEEALDRAAAILRQAQAPVVLGLTRTSNETVAAALAIADRIGAVVDVGQAAATMPALRAVQRIGRVSATLGEVKNRADVVVFWGVDPLVTHPRHWERYSVEPRGRFVPQGRAGRTVIVADGERTATADRADLFVPIAAERQFETLWTLRASWLASRSTRGECSSQRGSSLETLRSARRPAHPRPLRSLVLRPGSRPGPGGSACVEAALGLVRDLNARTRFVILPLGGAGNAVGAEAVLTWQTGSPQSVDFSGDCPRALAEDSSAAARLERGDADAALIVADAVEDWLPVAAREHLQRIPRIVIAPRATATDPTASGGTRRGDVRHRRAGDRHAVSTASSCRSARRSHLRSRATASGFRLCATA